jgi:hypothetical protein
MMGLGSMPGLCRFTILAPLQRGKDGVNDALSGDWSSKRANINFESDGVMKEHKKMLSKRRHHPLQLEASLHEAPCKPKLLILPTAAARSVFQMSRSEVRLLSASLNSKRLSCIKFK